MKQIYVPLSDNPMWRLNIAHAIRGAGMEIASAPTTPYVYPLSGHTAKGLSRVTGINYLSAEAHDIACDSTRRGQYLPSLPVVVPKSAADLAPLAGAGVFVKPRFNFNKLFRLPIAYKAHTSVDAFVRDDLQAVLDHNASCNEWDQLAVFPDLGHPLPTLCLDFAVNEQSDVWVYRTLDALMESPVRSSYCEEIQTHPQEIDAALQSFCRTFGVKGGLYQVQMVAHDGQWKVMDFNTRQSLCWYTAAMHPGALQPALQFMAGEPVQYIPTHLSLRNYPDRPLPKSRAFEVTALGLQPYWLTSPDAITRILAVGGTKAEVDAKFEAYEALLP